jgi:hypothetical protein
MILAIDALQVTVGEEDIANTVSPADHRLLPSVNTDRCNIK